MQIVCIDCGADIGCYIKDLKIKFGTIQCNFACYYGLCQRNSIKKSGGLCDDCFIVAQARRKDETQV